MHNVTRWVTLFKILVANAARFFEFGTLALKS